MENAQGNIDQVYESGKNDCDIWLEKNDEGTTIDLAKGWGKASVTNADGHRVNAGEGRTSPSAGLNFVVMQDGRNVPKAQKFSSHVVAIFVGGDGSVKVFEMDRPNSYIHSYDSVDQFKNDYVYDTFTFYPASKFMK